MGRNTVGMVTEARMAVMRLPESKMISLWFLMSTAMAAKGMSKD